MPLYELTPDCFRQIRKTSFVDLKLRERDDLQRLLRNQIEILGEDLYVLTEEFSDWEDSRCRIDLLAIDLDANLVVIELKRTNDGGHMELQSLRYASMVSAMTFQRAEQIHADYLKRLGRPSEESRSRILAFLNWNHADDGAFAEDVRIVLASEDFGKELTTTVLWLLDRGIDIRCIRMRPYQNGDTPLIDVQQIIPLPEASDYQVQLREKEQVERKIRGDRKEVMHRFWIGLVSIARERNTRHANSNPSPKQWLGANSGIRGLACNYVILKDSTFVEVYIDRGDANENKAVFDRLLSKKEAIESLFEAPLSWERLDERRACRVKHVVTLGGYASPESQWAQIQDEMVTKMIGLESALLPAAESLGI